jgi:glycosyltransferase involved in cell wall biosynthesis
MENTSYSRSRSSVPQKNMKVLIVSKSLEEQGGVVNFVSMLVNKFSAETAWEHLEIGKNSSRESFQAKLKILLSDNLRLKNRLSTGDCTLLHLNTSFNGRALVRDGSFLSMASLLGFKNSVVFFHGWDEGLERKLKESALWRTAFFHIFDRSKALIVLASRFRDTLVSMGFDPGKIRVFPTMFDGGLLAGALEGNRGAGTILFMSRMVREKGVYELLEAFAQLSERYRGIRLNIAGEGEESAAVARWIDSSGLGDRIGLLGYLRGEKKARALREADIFVLPTRHGEGCPVALLEAMAAGLAVIATPAGGIPDVFRDRVNGILLRDSRPATIAEAVAQLLDDDELRARTGEHNRREAWQKFESRIVARRLEELYREVAAAT